MSPRHTITELRYNLEDLKNGDQKLIQDDLYLALWLNLNRCDVKKAEAAIRDASQWWEVKDVPSIIREKFPLALTSKLPIFAHCMSREGLPFVYVRLTAMDINGLVQDYSTEDIARYTIQRAFEGLSETLEASRERYEKLGDEVLKAAVTPVAIVDMDGFSRKHIPPLKVIIIYFIQTAREYLKFPSTPRTTYIVGVSKFNRMFLKPFIAIVNAFGVNFKVYGTDERSWGVDIYKLFDKKVFNEFRSQSTIPQSAIARRQTN